MLPPLSATSRAMKIGITSSRLSQIQLSELVRWTIRPKLMGVPGVANVAVWGSGTASFRCWSIRTACSRWA